MTAKRAGPKTIAARRQRVAAVLPLLKSAYPDARCSLNFTTPLELLVATILSAQCTDERVNVVTRELFARFRTAGDYAAATQEDVESYVKTAGFFRAKARNIRAMAAALVERHHGMVPATMDELHALAGVGRKTANVVLGNCFGINVGVTVDTHVTRLSNRLGLTTTNDAVKIEQDLIPVVPQPDWAVWSNLLIHHGRAVCAARRPVCEACVLLTHCPTGPKVLRERAEVAAVRTVAKKRRPVPSPGTPGRVREGALRQDAVIRRSEEPPP